jgi:hypothetical protein
MHIGTYYYLQPSLILAIVSISKRTLYYYNFDGFILLLFFKRIIIPYYIDDIGIPTYKNVL